MKTGSWFVFDVLTIISTTTEKPLDTDQKSLQKPYVEIKITDVAFILSKNNKYRLADKNKITFALTVALLKCALHYQIQQLVV